MVRRVLALGVLVLLALPSLEAATEAPKVEVYARSRAEEGKGNVFQCFVNGFHPPEIEVQLLKNGEPMPDVTYGDLSFNEKWQFQRLVYAPFIPTREDIFTCRVVHSSMAEPGIYRWEPDF
ncbi:beta-2-microglobulin [Prinia subflava]|uniref:beta-2-microglobulin n=1 Tax=Prinia subflava TaxID=208062 RepID=UPI002FE2BE17